MRRRRNISWAEIVLWSAASGGFVLAVVVAIFSYVYFHDGATKVWFDGLTPTGIAVQCAAVWFTPAAIMFGFLLKIRLVEDESIARIGDSIDSSWRK